MAAPQRAVARQKPLAPVPAPPKFVPKEGSPLTVILPDETARLPVIGVIDDDNVVVEVDGVLFSRSHMFRKGDFLQAKRTRNDLSEIWEVTGKWRPPGEPTPPPRGKK